jgi:hypothetical protein
VARATVEDTEWNAAPDTPGSYRPSGSELRLLPQPSFPIPPLRGGRTPSEGGTDPGLANPNDRLHSHEATALTSHLLEGLQHTVRKRVLQDFDRQENYELLCTCCCALLLCGGCGRDGRSLLLAEGLGRHLNRTPATDPRPGSDGSRNRPRSTASGHPFYPPSIGGECMGHSRVPRSGH